MALRLVESHVSSPLERLVDDYLANCRARGLSPRTDRQYTYALRAVFLQWCAARRSPSVSSRSSSTRASASSATPRSPVAPGLADPGFVWRRTSVASADSLGQGDDDSLRPPHVSHAPGVLVLADAADQAVAVRDQSIEDRLKVIHFEHHVAQPELVGHGGGRSRLVVWSDEARQLQPGTTVGRAQHDDLGTGVGYATHGVQELTFHEHPALNLETQPDEERRHCVEVVNRDADVVETSNARHLVHPSVLGLALRAFFPIHQVSRPCVGATARPTRPNRTALYPWH